MTEEVSETAAQGLKSLNEVANNVGVSKRVRYTALDIYKQVVEETDLSGRSIKEITSGALLLSVERNSEPINIDELIDNCPSARSSVFREKNRIQSELGIETEPVTAEDYLGRYFEELDICKTVEEKTETVLQESENNGFMQAGKSPRGIAAGVLYLGALLCEEGQRLTQSELSEVAGVTEVTLRTHYRDIAELAGYSSEIEQAMETRV